MRLGILPGQQRVLQRALKKARKFDDFRGRTRRGFVLTTLGGLGASIGTFFVGRYMAGRAESAPSPAIVGDELSQRLATGSIDDLVSAYPTFLLLLERNPSSAAAFAGYARLVDAAVRNEDRTLARHLVESAATAPSRFSGLADLLRPILRR
ncbi:MAG: hypothetical protein R3F56_08420 [Planctomycetota bacterium]